MRTDLSEIQPSICISLKVEFTNMMWYAVVWHTPGTISTGYWFEHVCVGHDASVVTIRGATCDQCIVCCLSVPDDMPLSWTRSKC